MKFIYITKPLPVFNKKFRENSGNPSSMFIYKKTGYKEKLRLLYSASFGQKMRSFVSECRLRIRKVYSRTLTLICSQGPQINNTIYECSEIKGMLI